MKRLILKIQEWQKRLDLKKTLKFIVFLSCSLLIYFILPTSCPEAARRSAFVMTLACFLWVSELFELYVTSLLVIILLTFLLALPADMLPQKPSSLLFLSLFADPVILLFFGGFMLAQAIKKFELDHYLANQIFERGGQGKYAILTSIMITGSVIGLWISNTASAIILFALVQPFLRDDTIEDNLKKCILLAIPFTVSIFGTGTPIASPPNAIAIGLLEQKGINISFLEWMAVTLPLAFLRIILAFYILRWFFPITTCPKIPLKIHFLSRKGKIVFLITLGSIAAFMTSSFTHIPESLIALSTATILGLFGFLNYEDLKKIEWDILILMWGGLAMGLAIDKSGLGQWILNLPFLQFKGATLVIFLSLVAFLLSTIMSNTATSALILPLALSIEGENKIVLAVTLTLVCSLGLSLPISSPPNAIVFSSGHLKSKDLFKAGLTLDLLSLALIFIGFWWVIPQILSSHFN